MINLEIINHQLEKTGMSTYAFQKFTGLNYASVNSILRGKSNLENVKLLSYEAFMKLFTGTEKLLAEKSQGVKQYDDCWLEVLKLALQGHDVEIHQFDQDNKAADLPPHVSITWDYMRITNLNELRIFDEELYGKIGNMNESEKIKGIKEWIMKEGLT